jgi:ribosome-associated heat shock protein Hsp15
VPPADAVRVDVWIWAVRLFPTRTAASEACRAGHVRVNGVRVKPAHPVRAGDTVRTRTSARERIVVVTGVISKRVGAPEAAAQYDDESPPPPSRDERSAQILRDPGSGRPTKRDRRQTEHLRGRR